MSQSIGVWVAALATLSVYSYLYKENPFFRLTEHLLIGLTAAHLTVMGFINVRDMAWRPLITGAKLWPIFPIVGGLLLWARWFPKTAWLSRIPLSFMMCVAGAVTITGQIDAAFLRQISATMMPLNTPNNVIFVISVVCTLTYFFFTVTAKVHEHDTGAGLLGRRILIGSSEIGKWAMMIAFGTAFGTSVMARISLFIGRLQFLLTDWIHILQ